MVQVKLVALATLITWTCSYPQDYSNTYIKTYTRNVTLKQGTLQGIVVGFRANARIAPVEQYLGIPFASPPIGKMRFMYPGSAPSWFGTKLADSFGPVCPQRFPDERHMTQERKDAFLRLKELLLNESEDCLYLNVYAPFQGNGKSSRKYPVIVYIHGESFEWNSGNPYDGSVLAAYGNVVVVTLNYRLGVLGFLKAGIEEHSKSNFGLVDQVAALVWVKANIAAFGGDPHTITLLGQGTGAVCASLLMLSPMVREEGNKMLFQRSILMGGSALADWALAGNPREVTHQVATALNCQIDDDFGACLRRKRLDEVMAAGAVTFPYRSLFGPVVDSVVVPNEPKKSMTKYTDIFRRFELMYGVNELESVHLLTADALKFGILERERDQELRKYLRFRCEMKEEWCVTRTLAKYGDSDSLANDDGYTGHEPDRASIARDALLDILSDGRTVAPIVQMAKYHAALNVQSYFYVFTHKTDSKEYLRDKSYTGEELPYVFGVPLGGTKFHFADKYSEQEKLFSEAVMSYFANFAYTGNPNVPRRNEYYSLHPSDWIKYSVDWPEYDLMEQKYLKLDIPPYVQTNYREDKMQFWNDIFPEISQNRSYVRPPTRRPSPSGPPPAILAFPPSKTKFFNKYENFHKPLTTEEPIYGKVKLMDTNAPNNIATEIHYGGVMHSVGQNSSTSLTIATIVMATIFLVSNLLFFLSMYLRKYRKRKLRVVSSSKADEPPGTNQTEATTDEKLLPNGCNLMKIVQKSTRSEDTYEAVNKSSGSKIKEKLPRQMSSSTIDAHTKVRDWITNEIVYKYSPRFLRRNRRASHFATPSDSFRPPLLKSSSNPVQKTKPEKISIGIDATPSGRGPSVLKQMPIEATKSLDRQPFDLRRSLTLEDFSRLEGEVRNELRKSTTSVDLSGQVVMQVSHCHSRSEPVQDLYAEAKKLRTFDPNGDVNVTSCGEPQVSKVLTPEEALLTIKRRNYPKVLPDCALAREALQRKRRSMPATHHQVSFNTRPPPPPPLRTSSTLSRKPSSAPMLAEEPPTSPEPEVACNSLYFGPLIPKGELNTQPIYEKLLPKELPIVKEVVGSAKTIITTDLEQPIKRVDGKVVIRAGMARSGSDPKKSGARVTVQDNVPKEVKKVKPSMIPTLVKKESSSESSPSEESDTGTVKKV